MDEESVKEALKSAIKEWLDERFAQFGRWTLGALASAIVAGVAYGLIVLYSYKIG